MLNRADSILVNSANTGAVQLSEEVIFEGHGMGLGKKPEEHLDGVFLPRQGFSYSLTILFKLSYLSTSSE